MTTDLWARIRRLFGKRMPSHPMTGSVMDSHARTPNDVNPQGKFRHPAHDRIQGKVNLHLAAFVAAGTAGFLVGGAPAATAAVVVWTAVLIACWRLRAQALPGPAEQPPPSTYADIEDVIDRLDDLARERNWDLAKRLEIARLACENRAMTFDELGDLYDRGLRSAPDRIRPDASEGRKNDVSG